eukprot:221327-Prymnesium_polylepis.1
MAVRARGVSAAALNDILGPDPLTFLLVLYIPFGEDWRATGDPSTPPNARFPLGCRGLAEDDSVPLPFRYINLPNCGTAGSKIDAVNAASEQLSLGGFGRAVGRRRELCLDLFERLALGLGHAAGDKDKREGAECR